MKRKKSILVIAVVLLFVSPLLYAQSNKLVLHVRATTAVDGAVKLTIPFEFSAGGKTLGAGEYVIEPCGELAMMVLGTQGKGSVILVTAPVTSSSQIEKPKLVFHRYGDRYFLAQAWLNFSTQGKEFRIWPEEIKVAREYRQQQVTLVAGK